MTSGAPGATVTVWPASITTASWLTVPPRLRLPVVRRVSGKVAAKSLVEGRASPLQP